MTTKSAKMTLHQVEKTLIDNLHKMTGNVNVSFIYLSESRSSIGGTKEVIEGLHNTPYRKLNLRKGPKLETLFYLLLHNSTLFGDLWNAPRSFFIEWNTIPSLKRRVENKEIYFHDNDVYVILDETSIHVFTFLHTYYLGGMKKKSRSLSYNIDGSAFDNQDRVNLIHYELLKAYEEDTNGYELSPITHDNPVISIISMVMDQTTTFSPKGGISSVFLRDTIDKMENIIERFSLIPVTGVSEEVQKYWTRSASVIDDKRVNDAKNSGFQSVFSPNFGSPMEPDSASFSFSFGEEESDY